MRKLFITILLLSTFSFSFATVQDSLTVKKNDNGQKFIQYMVSPGETIYGISTKFGVSISELLGINPALENGLKVGQMLDIPYRPENIRQEPSSSNLSSEYLHVVQPGETLYSLSKKYNVSVGDLLKWNGMELKAGQQLVVKNPNPSLLPETKPTVATPKTETKPTQTTTSTKAQPVQQTMESTVAYKDPTKPTVTEKQVEKQANSTVIVSDPHSHQYHYNPNLKQVLIVPFDPHLYFSDADDEMAKDSHIPRVKIREVFRRRLNALIDPDGYEVIHLMGGRFQDTLTDLNKIYSSVKYNYQEILNSPYRAEVKEEKQAAPENTSGLNNWVKKQKEKIAPTQTTLHQKATTDKFEGKFFGVQVSDPAFFEYFQNKYSVDYYVFINQFEVITDYENCLDRSAHNYARYFIAHYTIMGQNGVPIAGNKFKIYYDSSTNDVMKITADNMGKMAQQIINDLPKPDQE